MTPSGTGICVLSKPVGRPAGDRASLSSGRSFAGSASPIPTQLSVENFARVMGTTAPDGSWLFGRQLFNSIVVSGATTIIGIALATTAAYAFSRFRFGAATSRCRAS